MARMTARSRQLKARLTHPIALVLFAISCNILLVQSSTRVHSSLVNLDNPRDTLRLPALIKVGPSVEVVVRVDEHEWTEAWDAMRGDPSWGVYTIECEPRRIGPWAAVIVEWNTQVWSISGRSSTKATFGAQESDVYTAAGEALQRQRQGDSIYEYLVHPSMADLYKNAAGPSTTVKPDWLGIASNLLILGIVILVFRLAITEFRKFLWRIRQGHCDHCGYELKGIADDAACPECGNSQTSGPDT